MKPLAVTIASLCLAASSFAQPAELVIIQRAGSQPSTQGPAERFTGTVRVDPLFTARDPGRTSGALSPSNPEPVAPGTLIRSARF
jgi:4-carboxymuconolactone decarboxylase